MRGIGRRFGARARGVCLGGLALGVFLLAGVTAAQEGAGRVGGGAGSTGRDDVAQGPTLQVSASVQDAGRQTWVLVTGGGDLPDGASLEVSLSNLVRNHPVTLQTTELRGGRFSVRLGPFQGGLYVGTYSVLVTFYPGLQDPALQQRLDGDARTRVLRGETQVRVGVPPPPAEQERNFLEGIEKDLLAIRALYIEAQKKVDELRAGYEATKDSAGAESWYADWGGRASGIRKRLELQKAAHFTGSPFVDLVGQLAMTGELLLQFGARYKINITGREMIDPADRGKGFEELARSGRLPSGMLRQAFLDAMRNLYQMAQLADPNDQLIAGALAELPGALTALLGAYEKARAEEKFTDRRWQALAKEYDERAARARAPYDEVMTFYDKRRRGLSRAEAQVRGRADDLETLLGRLEELAAAVPSALRGENTDPKWRAKAADLAAELGRRWAVDLLDAVQKQFAEVQGYYGTWRFAAQAPKEPQRRGVAEAAVKIRDLRDVRIRGLASFAEGIEFRHKTLKQLRATAEALEELAGLLEVYREACGRAMAGQGTEAVDAGAEAYGKAYYEARTAFDADEAEER